MNRRKSRLKSVMVHRKENGRWCWSDWAAEYPECNSRTRVGAWIKGALGLI